ncbi:MAG: TIGR00266 family protein [Proteobacteria bacterium]|nr:TIGR00266 family protein [Pseudomonadota bacterium]
MQHKLIGDRFPVLECTLSDGEAMVCEGGAMLWMTDNLEMDTKGGGVGGVFKKLISGEAPFQNVYTAKGDAKIAFGAGIPGTILSFELDGSRSLIVKKGVFLASQESVTLDIAVQKKITNGLFGGNGFVMQSVSGSGWVFLVAEGDIHEVDLAEGEVIVVDTDHLVGYESTVTFDLVEVAGLKNKLAGGEGLFNTKLVGPGKVWMQTMSLRAMLTGWLPVKA